MLKIENEGSIAYNLTMISKDLHSWHLTPAEAANVQKRLAVEVLREGDVSAPCIMSGVDVSVSLDRVSARAAVVSIRYPDMELLQAEMAEGKLDYPYIPGLLSFREARLILSAWEKITIQPDIVFVDGHGISHPRRLGIASHLGLWLNLPTIGCAKTRLCGDYNEPGPLLGDGSPLCDRGELVGMVLRTKVHAKPMFISVGHQIDLDNAVGWVIRCLRGYRLPEPIRLAHLAANNRLPAKMISTNA